MNKIDKLIDGADDLILTCGQSEDGWVKMRDLASEANWAAVKLKMLAERLATFRNAIDRRHVEKHDPDTAAAIDALLEGLEQ